MIVGLGLSNSTEPQSFVKPKRLVVLQPDSQLNTFLIPVSVDNDLREYPSADAAILVAWLHLDLANLHASGLIEQLDHANANAVHFYD
jgi:hypothetical protein